MQITCQENGTAQQIKLVDGGGGGQEGENVVLFYLKENEVPLPGSTLPE